MNSPVKSFFDYTGNLIFEEYKVSEIHLGILRILYCLIIFFFVGIADGSWVGLAPDFLYSPPPGLPAFFHGFPPAIFFKVIGGLIIVLYVLLLFGWYTPYVSCTITVLIIILNSFRYSFGKIDHDIIAVVFPFVLSFSGWGNAFSVDAAAGRKSTAYPWAVALAALVLGFAMFTAGVPKLLGGWLNLDTQAAMSYIILYDMGGREALLAKPVMAVQNVFFRESLDYVTIIFEIGFLFAFLNRKVFRFFVASAIVFHTFILLTLKIPSSSYAITYLVFINWEQFDFILLTDRMKRFFMFFSRPINLLVIMLITAGYVGWVSYRSDSIYIGFPSLISTCLSLAHVQIENIVVFIVYSLAYVIIIIHAVRFFMKKNNSSLAEGK